MYSVLSLACLHFQGQLYCVVLVRGRGHFSKVLQLVRGRKQSPALMTSGPALPPAIGSKGCSFSPLHTPSYGKWEVEPDLPCSRSWGGSTHHYWYGQLYCAAWARDRTFSPEVVQMIQGVRSRSPDFLTLVPSLPPVRYLMWEGISPQLFCHMADKGCVWDLQLSHSQSGSPVPLSTGSTLLFCPDMAQACFHKCCLW